MDCPAPTGIQAEDPIIAELLKPPGYATGQFGKNHFGDQNRFLPTAHGFDGSRTAIRTAGSTILMSTGSMPMTGSHTWASWTAPLSEAPGRGSVVVDMKRDWKTVFPASAGGPP